MNPVDAELGRAVGQPRTARTAQLLAAAARADGDRRGILLAEVVELNMYVADAVVPQYLGRGVATEELRRAAFLALVEAVDGFDPGLVGADFPAAATAITSRRLGVLVLDPRAVEPSSMGTSVPCRRDGQRRQRKGPA